MWQDAEAPFFHRPRSRTLLPSDPCSAGHHHLTGPLARVMMSRETMGGFLAAFWRFFHFNVLNANL